MSLLGRTQPSCDRGSSHKTFGVSHIQGLWRFYTCNTFGVSVHPGHLEHLCSKSFWDISAPGVSRSTFICKPFGGVSAPRISRNFYHCTSGAFLHPKLLGPRALGASLTEISWGVSHLEVFHTQGLWGVSVLRAFGTPHTPKLLGYLMPWALQHWSPRPSCRECTHQGSLSPTAKRTPTHVLPKAGGPSRTAASPCPVNPPRGATAQPQGARGAGREANSCGSARSGAAGEPEGSGTDPCRAVSSRAGS